MKVLITGASGNLGGKLLKHFLDKYPNVIVYALDIVPLDEKVKGDGRVREIVCDLTRNEEGWRKVFKEGIDIVYHFSLATNSYANKAFRSPRTWDESSHCCDAYFNVLVAAAVNQIPRVVFASSVHVILGHLELGTQFIRDDDDFPYQCGHKMHKEDGDNDDSTPYAVGKMAAERLAKTLGENFPRTKFICFRIGGNMPGENRLEVNVERLVNVFGVEHDVLKWAIPSWLSNADFIELMECARTSNIDDHKSMNLNAVSGIKGPTEKSFVWDMTKAKSILGFQHQQ